MKRTSIEIIPGEGILVTSVRLICIKTRTHDGDVGRVGGVKLLFKGDDVTKCGKVASTTALDTDRLAEGCTIIGGVTFDHPTKIDGYAIVTSSFSDGMDPVEWTLQAHLTTEHPEISPTHCRTDWVVIHHADSPMEYILPKERLVVSPEYGLELMCGPLACITAPPLLPGPKQKALYFPNGVESPSAHRAFMNVLSSDNAVSGKSVVLFQKEGVVHWGVKGFLCVVRYTLDHRDREDFVSGESFGAAPSEESLPTLAPSPSTFTETPDFLICMWLPYCLLLTVNQEMLSREAMKNLDRIDDIPFCAEGDASLIGKYPTNWKYACMIPDAHIVALKKKEPTLGAKTVTLISAPNIEMANLYNKHSPFQFRSRGFTQFCEVLEVPLNRRVSGAGFQTVSLEASLASVARPPSALKHKSSKSLPEGDSDISGASPTGMGNDSFGKRLSNGLGSFGAASTNKLSLLGKISRSFSVTSPKEAGDSPRSSVSYSPRDSYAKGGPAQSAPHTFDHTKLQGINIGFLTTEAEEYFDLSEKGGGTPTLDKPQCSNASINSTMTFHVMKPLTRDEWEESFSNVDGERVLTKEGWEAARVRCYEGGIQDPNVRKEVWSYLLGLYEVGQTAAEMERSFAEKKKEYDLYKHQWKTMTKAQERFSSTFRDEAQRVEKDVLRTDRSIPLYAEDEGDGLNSLRNILITYSTKYNPDLGYCQGMSDVASTLFYVFQCEVMGFWALAHVLEDRNLHIYFQKTQSGIAEKLRFIGNLLEVIDPSLHQYLESVDAANFNFCFRWVIVLFKREFNFADVLYLWDTIWACPFGGDFHLLLSAYLLRYALPWVLPGVYIIIFLNCSLSLSLNKYNLQTD